MMPNFKQVSQIKASCRLWSVIHLAQKASHLSVTGFLKSNGRTLKTKNLNPGPNNISGYVHQLWA